MKMTTKASSVGLNDLKMPKIHGETTIVLKNVKTGLVERIHSENTFQGSNIAKWLHGSLDSTPNANNYNDDAFRAAPWKGLVGGLLLFRDSITEGTSFMPAGNVMVGKGAIDISNASEPVELGSYNSIESSASGSSITQVYDFSTSQANGTIGCVCLTSKEGGFVGYGNTSGKWSASGRQALGNFYGGSLNPSSTGALGEIGNSDKRYKFYYDNDSIEVRKYRTNGINTGSVFAGLYTATTHDISSFQDIFKSGRVRCFYCGNDIYRFLPQSDYSVSASGTIYYMEYNAANDTLQEKTLLNSSPYTLVFGSSYYYDRVYGCFTKDNRLIAKTDGVSPERTVVIDMTTGATILTSGTSPAITPREGVCQVSNGLYICGGAIGDNADTCGIIIDTVNGTVKPIDFSYGPFNMTNCDNSAYFQQIMLNEGNYASVVLKNPLYLATINNLQSPVTKSAAQTMKVTYTLTEV